MSRADALVDLVVQIIRQRIGRGEGPQFIRRYTDPLREQGVQFGNVDINACRDLIKEQHPELAYMIAVREVKTVPSKRRQAPAAPRPESPAKVRRKILAPWDTAVVDSQDANLVVRLANLVADAQRAGDEAFQADMEVKILAAQVYLNRLLAVITDPVAAHRARTEFSERDDMRVSS